MCGSSDQTSSNRQTTTNTTTQTRLEDHSVTDIFDDDSITIDDDHSIEGEIVLGQGASFVGFSDETASDVLEFASDALEKGNKANTENFQTVVQSNNEALSQAFKSTIGGLADTNTKLMTGLVIAGLATAAYMSRNK